MLKVSSAGKEKVDIMHLKPKQMKNLRQEIEGVQYSRAEEEADHSHLRSYRYYLQQQGNLVGG